MLMVNVYHEGIVLGAGSIQLIQWAGSDTPKTVSWTYISNSYELNFSTNTFSLSFFSKHFITFSFMCTPVHIICTCAYHFSHTCLIVPITYVVYTFFSVCCYLPFLVVCASFSTSCYPSLTPYACMSTSRTMPVYMVSSHSWWSMPLSA